MSYHINDDPRIYDLLNRLYAYGYSDKFEVHQAHDISIDVSYVTEEGHIDVWEIEVYCDQCKKHLMFLSAMETDVFDIDTVDRLVDALEYLTERYGV